MNVRETLSELVAINSVSSNSNAEIIRYLITRVEALGLRTQSFDYTDAAGALKTNLVAFAPNTDAAQAELALVGHTDTVPFGASWTESLTLTEREVAGETRLYARGACDTKGFIAAALTAVESVDITRLTRGLALVFTADEELGCIGAKHLADAEALTARHAIVGEPTKLQPMRAGKGYCLAEVTVRGREAHSAYAHLGASAIFRAARLINRIEKIAENLKRHFHAEFDPPHTTVNVGIISGGTAKNVLAGACRFTLEWRPVPGQDARHVAQEVETAIEELRAFDSGFDADVEVTRLDGGIETPADVPLVRWLEEASGKQAGTVAFGTEAPQLAQLGADAVVFGPGDIRVAHTDDEYVPLADLERCAEILRAAVERFCVV